MTAALQIYLFVSFLSCLFSVFPHDALYNRNGLLVTIQYHSGPWYWLLYNIRLLILNVSPYMSFLLENNLSSIGEEAPSIWFPVLSLHGTYDNTLCLLVSIPYQCLRPLPSGICLSYAPHCPQNPTQWLIHSISNKYLLLKLLNIINNKIGTSKV